MTLDSLADSSLPISARSQIYQVYKGLSPIGRIVHNAAKMPERMTYVDKLGVRRINRSLSRELIDIVDELGLYHTTPEYSHRKQEEVYSEVMEIYIARDKSCLSDVLI